MDQAGRAGILTWSPSSKAPSRCRSSAATRYDTLPDLRPELLGPLLRRPWNAGCPAGVRPLREPGRGLPQDQWEFNQCPQLPRWAGNWVRPTNVWRAGGNEAAHRAVTLPAGAQLAGADRRPQATGQPPTTEISMLDAVRPVRQRRSGLASAWALGCRATPADRCSADRPCTAVQFGPYLATASPRSDALQRQPHRRESAVHAISRSRQPPHDDVRMLTLGAPAAGPLRDSAPSAPRICRGAVVVSSVTQRTSQPPSRSDVNDAGGWTASRCWWARRPQAVPDVASGANPHRQIRVLPLSFSRAARWIQQWRFSNPLTRDLIYGLDGRVRSRFGSGRVLATFGKGPVTVWIAACWRASRTVVQRVGHQVLDEQHRVGADGSGAHSTRSRRRGPTTQAGRRSGRRGRRHRRRGRRPRRAAVVRLDSVVQQTRRRNPGLLGDLRGVVLRQPLRVTGRCAASRMRCPRSSPLASSAA